MSLLKETSPWVPFDLYDFFGYLFPGVFLIVSIVAFLGHSYPEALSWHNQIFDIYKEAPFLIAVFLIISSLVLLYIAGHFIATLSHLMDRVLIAGISGYPIYHLLNLNYKEKRKYSDASVKAIFLLFNLSLITPFFCDEKLFLINNFLYAGIFGFALSRAGIAVIKIFRGDDIKIPQYSQRLFDVICKSIDAPFSLILNFVKRVFYIDKKFPDELINRYKVLFKKSFQLDDLDALGTENYWLPYFRVTSENQEINNLIRTWWHLYSFARNISAAAYLISFFIALWLTLSKTPWSFLITPSTKVFYGKVQLAITLTIAIMLAIRFLILYSTYYTKSIIRLFIILASDKYPETEG